MKKKIIGIIIFIITIVLIRSGIYVYKVLSDENDVQVEVSNGVFVTQYKRITKFKYWENGNMKFRKTYTLGQYDKKNINSTK